MLLTFSSEMWIRIRPYTSKLESWKGFYEILITILWDKLNIFSVFNRKNCLTVHLDPCHGSQTSCPPRPWNKKQPLKNPVLLRASVMMFFQILKLLTHSPETLTDKLSSNIQLLTRFSSGFLPLLQNVWSLNNNFFIHPILFLKQILICIAGVSSQISLLQAVYRSCSENRISSQLFLKNILILFNSMSYIL